MSAGNTLYTTRMLSLSAELAQYPLTDSFTLTAAGKSRTCGSTIDIGLETYAAGAVSQIGMRVTACAVGQSSAAIMASALQGCAENDLRTIVTQIKDWLSGEGTLPDWPRFDAVSGALEHKGRHNALLLPWTTALQALSQDRDPVDLSTGALSSEASSS